MSIKIVSDSSTLYNIEEGKKKGVTINPLSVAIGEKSYKDYEEMDIDLLYKFINEGKMPKTSQPNLGDLVDIFDSFGKEDEVLYISIADGISGAYNSAILGKDMSENKDRIHVLNSKTLCGPQRYLVDLAKKMVDAGESIERIKTVLKEKIESSKSYLMPLDFNFLKRGGRLSPLAANLASAIKLVPIMTLSEDCKSIVRHSINRTMLKALQAVVKQLQSDGVDETYKLYISHAKADENYLKKFKEFLSSAFPKVEIETVLLCPVFVSHGGPGCIAVQSIKK